MPDALNAAVLPNTQLQAKWLSLFEQERRQQRVSINVATTNYTYSLNAASAPKYPAQGQWLFLFEQELHISNVSATKWQPQCTGPLTCSFVIKSYFYWIQKSSSANRAMATFAACHNLFILLLGLKRQDTIICT